MMNVFAALAFLVMASDLAASPSKAELARALDGIVAPLVDRGAFSGVVLVAKGDTVLAERAWGMASYELGVPNRTKTRFRIASITKRFTVLVLARLVEEKRLSMEDSLAKFLPGFPKADRITIAQLAEHRSGLRDPEALRRIVPASYTTLEVVDLLARQPLGSEPGETFKYTTANYAVLAYVIEKVTGAPYSAAVRRWVYEPAGMTDAGDITTTSVIPRLASGYMPDPFGDRGMAVCGPEDTSWKTGGGSGYATARDLHKFLRALFAGRLLPKGTDPRSAFALTTIRGHVAFSSGGSLPGANATAIYYPDDEVSVVVLSNSYAPLTGAIAEQAAAVVLGDAPLPLPSLKPALPGPIDPRILGSYRLEGYPQPVTIEVRHGRTVASWNTSRVSAFVKTGKDEYFMPLDWATVTFRPAEGGTMEGSFAAPWAEGPLKLTRVTTPSPVP
jgi:D-alanyl-D-alanine carboxypeptidase